MLLFVCACWGIGFPLMKGLTAWWAAADPSATTPFIAVWSLALRNLIAGPVLALALARRLRGATRREWRQAAELALLGGVGTAIQMDGLAHTLASTSAFLTQGTALFVPLWLAARRRRWPHPVVWAALALVVAGGAVLSGVDLAALRLGRGETETLVSAAVFTGVILVIESPRFAGNDPWRVTALSMLCAGTLLAPAALLLAPQTAALAVPLAAPRPLAVLLFMAGVTTLVATALMFAFQPRIGAIAAGITYCGEPLFASLFALFVPAALSAWLGVDYPSETVTRSLAIGGGLVLAAILLVQAAPAPPPPGGGPRERA